MLSSRIGLIFVVELALDQELSEIGVQGGGLAFLDRVGVEGDRTIDAASLLGFRDPSVIALNPQLALTVDGSDRKRVNELDEVLAGLLK